VTERIEPILDAALTFLRANGYRVRDPSGRLYEAMLAIANRELDEEGLAAIVENLSENVAAIS
jgi:death-on-curing protein